MFSELDGALDSLGAQDGHTVGQNFTAWDKTKWAAKEKNIEKILGHLQMNKISLQNMLTLYLWFVARISYLISF